MPAVSRIRIAPCCLPQKVSSDFVHIFREHRPIELFHVLVNHLAAAVVEDSSLVVAAEKNRENFCFKGIH